MSTMETAQFKKAVLTLLDEAFDNVHHYFLDPHNSLFETLAGVTAEEASIPVGGKCATLAAQVRHTALYLDVALQWMRDPNPPRADWGNIWRTVSTVTPDEWAASQAALRVNLNNIIAAIEQTPAFTNDQQIAGAMAIVVHSAYHLGEIRQALCTIKA